MSASTRKIFEAHRLLDAGAQGLQSLRGAVGQALTTEERKALVEMSMLANLAQMCVMHLLLADDWRGQCPLRRSADGLGKDAVH